MNTLTFNSVQMEVIYLDGEAFLTQSRIGSALGYRGNSGLAHIFKTYRDEFDETMTRIIRIPTGSSKNNTTQARVFNRRGAWMLAMFSRTPIASEFRKWVLDVLEEHTAPQKPTDAPNTLPDGGDTREEVNKELNSLLDVLDRWGNTFTRLSQLQEDANKIGMWSCEEMDEIRRNIPKVFKEASRRYNELLLAERFAASGEPVQSVENFNAFKAKRLGK